MSDQPMGDYLAISDPGEVDREKHSRLDRFVVGVANIVAWALPLLMVAIIAQVFLRGAGHNQAWLDDLQWWIYGFAMMMGLAYAVTTNSHVRVDILHQHFSPERKARIEAFALGWMLTPFLFLMTDIMTHYALASIEAGEGSDSPNGLHRLYLLKSTLPFLFIITALAAWAALRRNLAIFAQDTWANRLIWTFPAAVFLLWRVLHYAAYWFISLTNAEINPRRITREPVFDHLLTVAFVATVLALAALWLTRRRASAGEG